MVLSEIQQLTPANTSKIFSQRVSESVKEYLLFSQLLSNFKKYNYFPFFFFFPRNSNKEKNNLHAVRLIFFYLNVYRSKRVVSSVVESLHLKLINKKINLHEDKELKFHGSFTQFCIY